jgi:hypothetical protein
MNKKQISEIKWNLINSALAGGLVFLGSAASGNITFQGFCAALFAGLTVAAIKFKDFWDTKKPNHLFQFIN